MKKNNTFSFSKDDQGQEKQEFDLARSGFRVLFIVLIFPLFAGTWTGAAQKTSEEKIVFQGNKTIPKNILNEAMVALSHYPGLKDVEIEFKYKRNIKNAFMQAQPKAADLFKRKKDRRYYIFMSSKFLIEDEKFFMADVPSEVLIGWLSHELGHIIDYQHRSSLQLMKFGGQYITSEKFIKKAERTADTYAINHGLGNYICATKDFILNHSHLSDSYKKRKARLYLSPEAIMLLVNSLEEELAVELETEEEES